MASWPWPWQRISIARALLRKPRLLVMDEPTSSLDAESETVILRAMETVFKDMTRIVIAHRLSTVMHADMIFVLDQGRPRPPARGPRPPSRGLLPRNFPHMRRRSSF